MIDGLVLADKPKEMASAALVTRLKKASGMRAGHTGTLDRFASGLMVLLLGRATAFSDLFLKLDKTYEATFQLGCSTDTLDPQGKILDRWEEDRIRRFLADHAPEIEKSIARRIFQTEQVPPEYSAIKHRGMRLSDRARQGLRSELRPRAVRFYEARCLSISPSGEVRAFFSVSSGTYIRSVARDIGEELGIPVHVSALRRLSVGHYTLDHPLLWTNLDEPPVPIGLLAAFPDWPRRIVSKEDRARVRNGVRLSFAADRPFHGNFFLLDEQGELLAWAEQSGYTYAYKKVFT
jgi:tRNA pseudouridine55 synthase